MSRLAVPAQVLVLCVLVHSLWGGNPIAVKFGLTAFGPFTSAFLRFCLGAMCVLAWAQLRGVRIWPRPGEWPTLVIIALTFTVQIGLMNMGYDRTTGAMGAVLIATNPLFAALFAHLLVAGDRLSAGRVAGIAVAMAGVAVCLVQDADPANLDFGAVGNWIVILSAGLLGLRLAFSARVLRSIDEARVAIWQMLLSLPLFAVGAALFESLDPQAVSWPAVAGIVYQGIVVAGVGFTASFALMKRYTPSVVMSFNFVSPVVGVLLAAWLLDEDVTLMLWLGMALVAAGLALVARRT